MVKSRIDIFNTDGHEAKGYVSDGSPKRVLMLCMGVKPGSGARAKKCSYLTTVPIEDFTLQGIARTLWGNNPSWIMACMVAEATDGRVEKATGPLCRTCLEVVFGKEQADAILATGTEDFGVPPN